MSHAAALLLRERLTAQLVAGEPARDPVAVAGRLLAVQAQDPRGARLAVRARTSGCTAGDVDRALDSRELVVSWLNRGTLHLVRSEDYPWLQALTTPPLFTGNARRLAQEGVDGRAAERGVDVIVRSLAADGPLTRDVLRERLAAAGVPTAGQALVHTLMLASLRGHVVRGPMAGRQQAFALVRDWLPEAVRPVDRDRALAELARRFLAGHGPADDRDLAKWAGLPLRDARAGLRAIAGETGERPGGLLALGGAAAPAEIPPPRLMGPFEPLLLGWRDRRPLLGDAAADLVTVNGIFRAFALVRGRAAATWRLDGGALALEPLGELTAADRAALAEDARGVERFLAAQSL